MGNCCASRKREEAPCQSDNEDNDNNVNISDIEICKEKIQMSLRVIEKNLGKSEEMKIKEVEMYIEEGKNLLFEIEKSVNMFEHAQMVIDIGKLCEKYKDFVDKGIRIKKLTQKLRRSDYVRNEKCMPQLDQKVIKCFSPKISNIQASNKVVIKKEDLVIVFV